MRHTIQRRRGENAAFALAPKTKAQRKGKS